MLPRRNCRGEFLLRQKSAERKPCRNRLGNGDDIRRDTEALKRENCSGATQAALDLIKNQRRAMTICQRAALLQKLHRTFVNPALPENWLEHNGAGIVIDCAPQTFRVVLFYKSDIFEQGLESVAMLVLAGT